MQQPLPLSLLSLLFLLIRCIGSFRLRHLPFLGLLGCPWLLLWQWWRWTMQCDLFRLRRMDDLLQARQECRVCGEECASLL